MNERVGEIIDKMFAWSDGPQGQRIERILRTLGLIAWLGMILVAISVLAGYVVITP